MLDRTHEARGQGPKARVESIKTRGNLTGEEERLLGGELVVEAFEPHVGVLTDLLDRGVGVTLGGEQLLEALRERVRAGADAIWIVAPAAASVAESLCV